MIPKVSVKPTAISVYIAPITKPFSAACASSVACANSVSLSQTMPGESFTLFAPRRIALGDNVRNAALEKRHIEGSVELLIGFPLCLPGPAHLAEHCLELDKAQHGVTDRVGIRHRSGLLHASKQHLKVGVEERAEGVHRHFVSRLKPLGIFQHGWRLRID